MAVGSTQPTGAQKHDDGKPAMELIDAEAMEDLARVLEFGRRKYGAHNWRGGIGIGRLSGVKHGAVIPKCLQERFATVHDRPHWVLIKAVTGWVFVSALVDNFWSPECHFR